MPAGVVPRDHEQIDCVAAVQLYSRHVGAACVCMDYLNVAWRLLTPADPIGPSRGPQPVQKKVQVDSAALERAGYKAGPSVLHVPEQRTRADEVWEYAAERKTSVLDHSPTPEVPFRVLMPQL